MHKGVKLACRFSQAANYLFFLSHSAILRTCCGEMFRYEGASESITLMSKRAVAWGCQTPRALTSATSASCGGSLDLS